VCVCVYVCVYFVESRAEYRVSLSHCFCISPRLQQLEQKLDANERASLQKDNKILVCFCPSLSLPSPSFSLFLLSAPSFLFFLSTSCSFTCLSATDGERNDFEFYVPALFVACVCFFSLCNWAVLTCDLNCCVPSLFRDCKTKFGYLTLLRFSCSLYL